MAAIETGDVCSMSQWKKLVNTAVLEREQTLWNIQSTLYTSLNRLTNTVQMQNLHAWWIFAHNHPTYMYKCKTIMAIVLEVHRLNSCSYRYKDSSIKSSLCTFVWDKHEPESIEHMLFKCDAHTVVREPLWLNVLEQCPSDILRRQIMELNAYDRATLLINGLNNAYTAEWSNFFIAIITFVCNMYQARLRLEKPDTI